MRKSGRKTFLGVIFSVMFLIGAGTAQAQLSVSDVTGDVGDIITVPILINNASNDVDSFGLELTFDSSLLEFKNTSSSGTLAKGMFVSGNLKAAGVLTIGGFLDLFSSQLCAPDGTLCPSGISQGASGTLVNVIFQVKSPCVTGSLSLQSLNDDFSPDDVSWATVAGSLTCAEKDACTEGATQQCDNGLPGPCSTSIQTCDANGNWGVCVQGVQAANDDTVWDGIDSDCNGVIDDGYDSTRTAVQLNAGWNLISLNLQPTSTAIDDVLSSIADKYISVYANIGGSWKSKKPQPIPPSSLTVMEAGWGYWVNMSEPGTLIVSGSAPSKTISLIEGWNLVGLNPSDPIVIDDALASIADKYVSVYANYDGVWKSKKPQPIPPSTLKIMKPRNGYWIKTTEAIDWVLP